jgi:hypothetical protein
MRSATSMPSSCPECDAEIPPRARKCKCGWQPTDERGVARDPLRWTCVYEEAGQRCAEIASYFETVHGHGGPDGNAKPHGYCFAHFPAFRRWGKARGVGMPAHLRQQIRGFGVPLAEEAEAIAERLAIQRDDE